MMSGMGMKLILVTLFLFAATFASPRTAWGGHSSYGWISTADIDPRAFIAETDDGTKTLRMTAARQHELPLVTTDNRE